MPEHPLTSKQVRDYINNNGETCPYCGGDIEGQGIVIEGNAASQRMNCFSCDRRWVDIYTLSDVLEYD